MRYDPTTYYRYYAYQKYLEEKKKRERNKRIGIGIVIITIVIASIYFGYFKNVSVSVQGNQTTAVSLDIPPSAKVVFNGQKYVVDFNVGYVQKPPSLTVIGQPTCSVKTVSSTSASIECTYDVFTEIPDKVALYDGMNVYYVPLDKFAVATFKRFPDGNVFDYPSVIYSDDSPKVKFAVISDRMLANPVVKVYGATVSDVKYNVNKIPNGFEYDFTVILGRVTTPNVKVMLSASNLKKPLTGALTFKVVKRSLTITEDFQTPVLVVSGDTKTIVFNVLSNYNTILNVQVNSPGGVKASYENSIILHSGSVSNFEVLLSGGNVTDTEEANVLIILSDGHVKKKVEVPVVVIPEVKMSVDKVNAVMNGDGTINVTLDVRSSLTVNARVTFFSSVANTHSFPKKVSLVKGDNKITFDVFGYPLNAKSIDVRLTFDLSYDGVTIGKVTMDITLNVPGG